MNDDAELLRRYAGEGAEDAFAEVVRRHVDLVYGVALRQTRGNAGWAEEVAQAVFSDLARKAAAVARHESVVGWLHTATRFAVAKALRTERRRRAREQEVFAMNERLRETEAAADWERLRPVIDEALGELKERERAAILLRFFERKPLAEVGAALALTETAARSCVDRALDKLHAALARRGISSTSAALGVALGGQVVGAAPAGLAASVTSGAMAEAAGVGVLGWGAAVFMGTTKIQWGILGALVAAGVTGYVVQTGTQDGLRGEIGALRGQQPALVELRAENRRLAATAMEADGLRRDDVEFRRLARDVEAAKKAGEDNARVALQREAERGAQAVIEQLNREGGCARGGIQDAERQSQRSLAD